MGQSNNGKETSLQIIPECRRNRSDSWEKSSMKGPGFFSKTSLNMVWNVRSCIMRAPAVAEYQKRTREMYVL